MALAVRNRCVLRRIPPVFPETPERPFDRPGAQSLSSIVKRLPERSTQKPLIPASYCSYPGGWVVSSSRKLYTVDGAHSWFVLGSSS